MKWYWAILLTVIILGITAAAVQANEEKGMWFVHLVTAILGIWTAGKSSSFGWGLFVFFLLPVGFPWFLMAKYKPEAAPAALHLP